MNHPSPVKEQPGQGPGAAYKLFSEGGGVNAARLRGTSQERLMPDPLRSLVRSAVVTAMQDHLRAHSALLERVRAVRGGLTAAHDRLARLQARLDALEQSRRLATLPWSGTMTVDQAWRRHPGAPGVFAAHHLPACDGCSVRFDEKIEEACLAYSIDLEALLAELSALDRHC